MKVQLCMGAKCTMMGANSIYDALDNLKEFCGEDYPLDHLNDLEVELVNCLDYCKKEEGDVSPVVVIDGEVIYRATAQEVSDRVITELSQGD
ncbi:MAG: (2Fe-2S) ferredoxin domain-containing protein [Tissierellia bacterium]|nr:(2Fe-2S) ferredoxin domain-containing protein [Tissierellia bacterium]